MPVGTGVPACPRGTVTGASGSLGGPRRERCPRTLPDRRPPEHQVFRISSAACRLRRVPLSGRSAADRPPCGRSRGIQRQQRPDHRRHPRGHRRRPRPILHLCTPHPRKHRTVRAALAAPEARPSSSADRWAAITATKMSRVVSGLSRHRGRVDRGPDPGRSGARWSVSGVAPVCQ